MESVVEELERRQADLRSGGGAEYVLAVTQLLDRLSRQVGARRRDVPLELHAQKHWNAIPHNQSRKRFP